MKLYFAPGACSLSPHIVAREAGLPVELVRVHLGAKKLPDGGDYRRINPKGQVPALEIGDGQVLTEGPAIVQYLADQAPSSGLVPAAGTFERYREIEWLNYVSTELHKNFSPLFNPRFPAEAKEIVKANLAARLEYLSKVLADREYLLGATFTAADAYLFTILRWAPGQGIDLAQYPVIAAYVARVAARPAVAAALEAEGVSGK
jgi:glutathione S-transferase